MPNEFGFVPFHAVAIKVHRSLSFICILCWNICFSTIYTSDMTSFVTSFVQNFCFSYSSTVFTAHNSDIWFNIQNFVERVKSNEIIKVVTARQTGSKFYRPTLNLLQQCWLVCTELYFIFTHSLPSVSSVAIHVLNKMYRRIQRNQIFNAATIEIY